MKFFFCEDVCQFHDSDYIDFLQRITPDDVREIASKSNQFQIGDTSDCPIFDGVFEFNAKCTAGSVDGAVKLNHGTRQKKFFTPHINLT